MSQTENAGESIEILNEKIIRPNFLIPEAEKSEPLKEFVKEKCWENKNNFKRTYGLRVDDAREQGMTVGYIFEPLFAIPDKVSLAIKKNHQFFGMLPPTPESPVLALVSLVPLDIIKGGKFEKKSQMDPLPTEDLSHVSFIVMDGHNFGDLLNQWDDISEETVEGQSQWTRRKEPFEKMILHERIRGLFTTHYCDEYFRLKLSEQGQVPVNSQHLVVRNQTLIYATPRLVAGTGFKANLYKRTGKNPTGFWPPQLRRCGKSVYWSQHSGKELMRWKDSEGQDYHDATHVCDLRKHDYSVRRIAASDATRKDRLLIVANYKAEWKLLHFENVNTGSFVEMKCPLRSLDSVAVMNDVVYVMGCKTDSMFPDIMVYKNPKDGLGDDNWQEIKRIRDILPNAFFPLNGRLYLLANGLDTIEVFDPETRLWTLNRIPRDMNDICGFALFGNDSQSAKLREA